MSKSEPSSEESYQEYLDEITIYGLSVCENCNKSTDVVYKCYTSTTDVAYNVVYRCYECAFEDGGKDE